MQCQRKQHVLAHGFTLVEVVTVAAIVAVVAAIAWVAIAGRVKGAAKRAVIVSGLRQISTSLTLYRSDNDDALPSNWRSIGYYGVNRKGALGAGFPPTDVYYDKPPEYDVSYHTPECAAPPAAPPVMYLFRQYVDQFNSKARMNLLDLDKTVAVRFQPACQASSFGKHQLSYLRDGELRSVPVNHVKSLSVNAAGTLSYQWWPDWDLEMQLSR